MFTERLLGASTALGTKGTVAQAAQFLLARNFYANWKDKHESNNHIKIYIVQTGRKKKIWV